jgi:hypothetical protein
VNAAPFTVLTAQVWRANQPGRSRAIGRSDPIPFGKHKGTPIEQVDPGWLRWARDQSDYCDPDSLKFWPELRAAIVSVVGEPVPGEARPRVMSLPDLVAALDGRGIRLSARGRELATSEAVADPKIEEALRVHRPVLLALIAIIDPRAAPGSGSARLIWAADLRRRLKAWYGALSRRFHPDKGGSTEGQIAVNESYRTLMQTFDEWEATP